MIEKGPGTFASRHEVFGVIDEEHRELAEALCENDPGQFDLELVSLFSRLPAPSKIRWTGSLTQRKNCPMTLHEIYQQMKTKYGWESGDNCPGGLRAVRTEIVKAINVNLNPHHGLKLIAFDLDGPHNNVRIGFINIKTAAMVNTNMAVEIQVEHILNELEAVEMLLVEHNLVVAASSTNYQLRNESRGS
ncbi:MAG: hypothetical protein JEZ11_03820 [Desulfobacterales bacterium]|nr:hypothetical protein [Desulfobacterales bacterium]